MYINTNNILTHKPHTIQTGVKTKHTNKKHCFTRKSQHRTKHVKGYNWTKWTKLTQLKPRGVLRYHERERNFCFISDTLRAKNPRIGHEKEKTGMWQCQKKYMSGILGHRHSVTVKQVMMTFEVIIKTFKYKELLVMLLPCSRLPYTNIKEII